MNRALRTPEPQSALVDHRYGGRDNCGDASLDAVGCGRYFLLSAKTCTGQNTMSDPRFEETEMHLNADEVRAIRDAMSAWLERTTIAG